MFPWTEDPPGARASEVYCRGCSAPLWPAAASGGLWEDAAGVVVCVKARLEDTGTGERPAFIYHQPMPSGLAGSPAGPGS